MSSETNGSGLGASPPPVIRKKTLKSQSVNNLFKQITSSAKSGSSRLHSPSPPNSGLHSSQSAIQPSRGSPNSSLSSSVEHGVKTLSLSSSSAKLRVIQSSNTTHPKSATNVSSSSGSVWKRSISPETPAWGAASTTPAPITPATPATTAGETTPVSSTATSEGSFGTKTVLKNDNSGGSDSSKTLPAPLSVSTQPNDSEIEGSIQSSTTDLNGSDTPQRTPNSSSKFNFLQSSKLGSFSWADADDDEEFGKSLWADIKDSLDKHGEQEQAFDRQQPSQPQEAALKSTSSSAAPSVWKVLDPPSQTSQMHRSASAASTPIFGATNTPDILSDPDFSSHKLSLGSSTWQQNKVRSPFDANESRFIFEDPNSRFSGSVDGINRELFNPHNGRFEASVSTDRLKTKRNGNPDRTSVPFVATPSNHAALTRHSTSDADMASSLWNNGSNSSRENPSREPMVRSISSSGPSSGSKFFRSAEKSNTAPPSFINTNPTSPLWFAAKDGTGVPDFNGSGFNSPNSSSSSSMARMSRFFPSPIAEQREFIDANSADGSNLSFNLFSPPVGATTPSHNSHLKNVNGMGISLGSLGSQPPPMRLDSSTPDHHHTNDPKPGHLVAFSAETPKSSIEEVDDESFENFKMSIPRGNKPASLEINEDPKAKVGTYIRTVINKSSDSNTGSDLQLVMYVASLPLDAKTDAERLIRLAFKSCEGEIVSLLESTNDEGGKDGFLRYRITSKLKMLNAHTGRLNLPAKMTSFRNSSTGEEQKMLLFITGDFPHPPTQKKLRDTINDVSSYPEGFSSTFHRRGINNFMFVRELQSKMIITKTRLAEFAEFRISLPSSLTAEDTSSDNSDDFKTRHKKSYVVSIDLRELENKSQQRRGSGGSAPSTSSRFSDRKRSSYSNGNGNGYHKNAAYHSAPNYKRK
ncbi:unnamed protein product [Kuraishia capsulata CBS 1993]|uniref:Uncharacterized protein n=1 Tax=Kuraishia capsulata CBS 1993 TaxID=1382522 RepID=W6MI33_9ASCO|nr:uncharacterized protein KUCA_T00001741001 [Kuraishia capsulata CBS 1993]CDK25771.1 unnamed protein product [Kuraishia capsulata CBS 1993]